MAKSKKRPQSRSRKQSREVIKAKPITELSMVGQSYLRNLPNAIDWIYRLLESPPSKITQKTADRITLRNSWIYDMHGITVAAVLAFRKAVDADPSLLYSEAAD